MKKQVSFAAHLITAAWNFIRPIHLYVFHCYIYLASISDIVISLQEQVYDLFSDTCSSILTVSFVKNAGGFGAGSRMVSFKSMETTSGMVGRSVAWSCTHNSPTCMHLITSVTRHGSPILGSTSS